MNTKFYNAKDQNYFFIVEKKDDGFETFLYNSKNNNSYFLDNDTYKTRCFPVSDISRFVYKNDFFLNFSFNLELDKKIPNDKINNLFDYNSANNSNLMLSVSSVDELNSIKSAKIDLIVDSKIYNNTTNNQIIDILYKNKILKNDIKILNFIKVNNLNKNKQKNKKRINF